MISFTNRVTQYTPDSFPTNINEAIIAPYWADVDIRWFGDISYRVTSNVGSLGRADNDIRRAFPNINFSSRYLFIATWDHVPFFNRPAGKVKV